MKVLVIDANPKTKETSHSKWAAAQYIEALKTAGHEIETWKTYKMAIPMIDEDVMNAFGKMMSGGELTLQETDKMNVRGQLLETFMAFDHYIVVSPLWNFGIPPQLKALIDVVAVAGKTFKYTDKGPVGLLDGTFVHVHSAGGVYDKMPEIEFSHRYISQVFKFMGLEEKEALLIEGTNMGLFTREDFQPRLDQWVKEVM